MSFSESYTWDIDQHILSHAILSSGICSLPGDNKLWKELNIEPRLVGIHLMSVGSWSFLTCGYKVSLILSKKCMAFMKNYCILWIGHDTRYLRWVNFGFSKSIFYVKNCLYYLKRQFSFMFLDILINNFYKSHVFLTLNLQVLYFLKLCPIFVGPRYVNSQNTAISLKPIHFFW